MVESPPEPHESLDDTLGTAPVDPITGLGLPTNLRGEELHWLRALWPNLESAALPFLSARLETKSGIEPWLGSILPGPGLTAPGRTTDGALPGENHIVDSPELFRRRPLQAAQELRAGLREGLVLLSLSAPDERRAQTLIDALTDLELARQICRQGAKRRAALTALGLGVASIAHELRNPLAVMRSSLYLLDRKVLEPKVRKHVERLGRQVDISARIIEGLLNLAKGKPPQRQRFSFREVAEEAIAQIPTSDRSAIRLRLPDDLPPLLADRDQLTQVLLNLLNNAVGAIADAKGSAEPQDFSRQGFPRQGISLRPGEASIEVRARVESSGDFVFEVSDRGAGIDEALLPKIFQPLESHRAGGIGLGLALCAQIVKAHGGKLEARNRSEGGACFEVTLTQDVGLRALSTTRSERTDQS